jgi:hypothetical protein
MFDFFDFCLVAQVLLVRLFVHPDRVVIEPYLLALPDLHNLVEPIDPVSRACSRGLNRVRRPDFQGIQTKFDQTGGKAQFLTTVARTLQDRDDFLSAGQGKCSLEKGR